VSESLGVAAILDRVRAAVGAARSPAALAEDVLDAAAALPIDERVRLKAELKSLGVAVRDWWTLVQGRVAARQRMRVVGGEGASVPRIMVLGGDLAKLTRKAIEVLADRREVFAREGEFVTALPAEDGRAPKLVPLPTDTVRVLLADSAAWAMPTEEGWTKIDPPPNVVAGAAACPWKHGVRRIEQIVETPTIRPDGSLVTEPGYDEAMRVLFVPNAEFPTIPEAPEQADASAALFAIREVFENFPCETECDRMILVAAVITLLCRAAIQGAVPGFVVTANSKGTGKTKALGAVCLLGTGRDASTKGWPVEEAELEKALDTAAIEGAPYVFFDNLEAPFAGAVLCNYLTATTVQPRDFGRKRTITAPWRGLLLATGNNLQLGRDVDRRVLQCHLLVEEERPWLRPETAFRHHPLEPWILAERPRLVVAVLTLVRAWILAGRPRGSQPTLGSFEAWSRFVPDAIEWAGGANPLERSVVAPEEGETEEDKAFRVVLKGLRRLDPDGLGLTARDLRKRLYPGDRAPGADVPPDGFDDLRDALEAAVPKKSHRGVPESHGLGLWLRGRKNQRRGDLKLVAVGAHDNVQRWAAALV
jgi:putative DNA primase/helicase